jgi:hypothetical protein
MASAAKLNRSGNNNKTLTTFIIVGLAVMLIGMMEPVVPQNDLYCYTANIAKREASRAKLESRIAEPLKRSRSRLALEVIHHFSDLAATQDLPPFAAEGDFHGSQKNRNAPQEKGREAAEKASDPAIRGLHSAAVANRAIGFDLGRL